MENVHQVAQGAGHEAAQIVQNAVGNNVQAQPTVQPQIVQQAVEVVHQTHQVMQEAVHQQPPLVQEAVQQMHQKVQEAVHQAPEVVHQVHQMVEEAVHQAPEVVNQAHQVVQEAVHQAPEMVQQAHQVVQEVIHQAPEVVQEAVHQAPEMVQQAHQVVQEAVHHAPEVVNQVHQVVQEAMQQAPEVVHQAHQVVQEAVQQAPEVVNQAHQVVQEAVKQAPEVAHQAQQVVQEAVHQAPEVGNHAQEVVQEAAHQAHQVAQEAVHREKINEVIQEATKEPEKFSEKFIKNAKVIQQKIVDRTSKIVPENLRSVINDYNEDTANQVTSNLFLMSSIVPTLIVFFLYFVFVKIVGPRLTKTNRKMNKTFFMYSTFQILLNSYLLYSLNQSKFLLKYTTKCKANFQEDIEELMMAQFSHTFFLTKFLEFIGPILLTLARQFDQISTFKLMNDGFMVVSVWFAVKYFPPGILSLFILADLSSKILTHFYFLATSYKPKSKSPIFLAILLVKMTILFGNAFEMILANHCGFPYVYLLWLGVHATISLVEFGNKCRKPVKKKEKSECEPYLVESTYVSYNNYERNNNLDFDIKRRYITTLKAQV